MFRYATLVIIIALILSGCNPSISVPPTLPSTPSFTNTPTLKPSSTKIRTSTPTSTPTRLRPTKTNTPESIVLQTLSANYADQFFESPNKEFIAVLVNARGRHPALDPQAVEILDKNGLLLWKIKYQHETVYGDPHPWLGIYGWSKDSAYLYFYYSHSPDGGDRAFWWDGFDLQKINILTGSIRQIIPGERKGFVSFSFSTDGTQIAYTRAQDNPSIIFIRDLLTGSEKQTDVIFPEKGYIRVGDLHWSPSSKEIAFQTEAENYIAQTVLLDLSTMQQKIIREYKVNTSYFQGWTSNGYLAFIEYPGNDNYYIVYVNPQNSDITIIGTPTFQP